jgi:hypothetical protein
MHCLIHVHLNQSIKHMDTAPVISSKTNMFPLYSDQCKGLMYCLPELCCTSCTFAMTLDDTLYALVARLHDASYRIDVDGYYQRLTACYLAYNASNLRYSENTNNANNTNANNTRFTHLLEIYEKLMLLKDAGINTENANRILSSISKYHEHTRGRLGFMEKEKLERQQTEDQRKAKLFLAAIRKSSSECLQAKEATRKRHSDLLASFKSIRLGKVTKRAAQSKVDRAKNLGISKTT